MGTMEPGIPPQNLEERRQALIFPATLTSNFSTKRQFVCCRFFYPKSAEEKRRDATFRRLPRGRSEDDGARRFSESFPQDPQSRGVVCL